MVETLTVSLEPYEFAASASAICGRFQIGMCYIATNHSCFTQNTRIAVARVYVIRSHQHRSVPLASKVLASSAVSNGKRWVKIGIELDYLCAYWVLLNGMLMRTGKYSASFSCQQLVSQFIHMDFGTSHLIGISFLLIQPIQLCKPFEWGFFDMHFIHMFYTNASHCLWYCTLWHNFAFYAPAVHKTGSRTYDIDFWGQYIQWSTLFSFIFAVDAFCFAVVFVFSWLFFF